MPIWTSNFPQEYRVFKSNSLARSTLPNADNKRSSHQCRAVASHRTAMMTGKPSIPRVILRPQVQTDRPPQVRLASVVPAVPVASAVPITLHLQNGSLCKEWQTPKCLVLSNEMGSSRKILRHRPIQTASEIPNPPLERRGRLLRGAPT